MSAVPSHVSSQVEPLQRRRLAAEGLNASPFAPARGNPRRSTRTLLNTVGAVGAAVLVASFVGGEWQGRLLAIGTGACTAFVSWRAVRRMWGRTAMDIVGLGALYGIANASLMALACTVIAAVSNPASICVVLVGGQVVAMFVGCLVGFLYGAAYAALLRSRMGTNSSRARDGRLIRPFSLSLWYGFLSLVVGSISVVAQQRAESLDLSRTNHWIGLTFAVGLALFSQLSVLRAVLAYVRAHRWLRRVERGALPAWGVETASAASKALPLLFEGAATRVLVRRGLGEGPFRDVAPVPLARLPETRGLAMHAALGCVVFGVQCVWIASLLAR